MKKNSKGDAKLIVRHKIPTTTLPPQIFLIEKINDASELAQVTNIQGKKNAGENRAGNTPSKKPTATQAIDFLPFFGSGLSDGKLLLYAVCDPKGLGLISSFGFMLRL